jgi:hypothetical protein
VVIRPYFLLRCVFILCAVLAGLPIHVSAAAFTVQAASPQIEFGKPLTLTLRSATISQALDTLTLTALQENFAIKPLGSPAINKHSHQQRWQLRLYAYHVGQHTIPSLSFAGGVSKPITLSVTPPIDAKTQAPIEITHDISTTTPWYKQQVLVTRRFTTAAPIVVFDTPEITLSNAKAIPLLVKREPVTAQIPALTRHTTGWAVFPLQHGAQTIELPPIAYVRDGVRTHLFYQKPFVLKVKPLPVYLPATIPVGTLQLRLISYPGQFHFSQHLAEAQLQLTAHGMLAADLPVLTPQLRSSDAITLHPLEHVAQQTATTAGIHSVADYRLPFTLHSQGLPSLPALRVQYFDPATGKIHGDDICWPRLMVVNRWLAACIGLVLGLLLLRGGWYLVNIVHRQWCCLQGYRQAVTQLASATTPQSIKQVLMSIARAERWPANLTLQQWHTQWLTRRARIHFNDAVLNALSQSLYHAHPLDLYRTRQTILNLCRSRWPYIAHLFALPV